MDEYVKLAIKSIATYVETGNILSAPADLPDEFYRFKKGVFVTIYKKTVNGIELRGCIGTFLPTKDNLATEIIDNAISAAANDYRFVPVSKKELPHLQYEVSILENPEKIDSTALLDPKKYGIIVKCADGRTGLLLPDIEGIHTFDHQINIACRKADIDPLSEKFNLYRFTVEKHK